ncbi:MAG: DHHW family protein [Defluviitaleaceae bacterium]|nr:DHHW family protein [Defluviitaleaceae bacterium]
MKKILDLILAASFLTVIYAFFIVNVFKPADEISFSERRKLAQFPVPGVGSILDASFMKGFDDYAVDQAAFRNEWRRLKAFFDTRVLLKSDNNLIFVEGDMVFKTEYPLREGNVRRLCQIINYCYERYAGGAVAHYAIVPDKNYYLRGDRHLSMDYYALADLARDNLHENIKYVDLYGALSLDCYYMTDSHWRQDRLAEVVNALAEGMGKDGAFDAGNYTLKAFSPFYGVFYGQSALNVMPDEIVYLVSEVTDNALVRSLEKPGVTIPVYDESALGGIDSYSMFMAGPQAIVTAANPLDATGRGLVIFRDSYASSLSPLLLDGYAELTLVDLRYIRPDLLGEPEIVGDYLNFAGKDILFLFSATIFNNSESIQNAPDGGFVSPFFARARLNQ